MKTRIFTLLILLLFLLTACGKANPTVENTNAPLETEMQSSAGDSIAVIPPQESGDSASNNSDSQTKPASSSFHCEPVTFDGYSLTPEGDSVPVRLTMAVENVLEGEAAWQQMISQGTQFPAPEQGKEYILVTVKVTYEDGDLETLNFVENYPASWAAARVHFNIPNDNSNTEWVSSSHRICCTQAGLPEFPGAPLPQGDYSASLPDCVSSSAHVPQQKWW